MPVDCQRSTSGGKGNQGMFIERDPRICSAGLPTAQPDDRVGDSLEHYLLKDETDALLSDAILPLKKSLPLPPLRHPIPPDMRFAGPFCNVAKIVNPPIKTKFQTLVEDLKTTIYSSYWKSPLGQVKDSVPMLPEGFDGTTTFGKKTPDHGRLYEIVMPKEPCPDTEISKQPGIQKNRKYCSPPYRSDVIYGHRTLVDKRGTYARCCLTDDRVAQGAANRTIINSIQSNFQDINQPRIGTVLAPCDNIVCVPKGYSFGKIKKPDNLAECLTPCQINPNLNIIRKCLKHLNTLRKCLSTRFLPTFFQQFYLSLKYFDGTKSGWIPKNIVYECCGEKLIRFDPSLIEPLLYMWQAFNGEYIEYKTFVYLINYREPLPDLPKIPDLPAECLDFRTTYSEMVKAGKTPDPSPMAGLPSGRYFDMDDPVTPERYCKADRSCLPQESDVKSCISPSVLTLFHVSHRDMFQKRDPKVIRKVFEATGEVFSDDEFHTIWKIAEKCHSKGWVCIESFRRAMDRHKLDNDNKMTDSN
ncbi:EF-hand domain-containing family member B [Bombyx mandarina]|uniref:EF-hand domain-containing family member B n=1 Tax=Bombyx mandarina TaxID=7092 RepID=A0A6J2JGK8_BOMMA|nr:EF-hand domain-containing family member B [Bombyx mandarina]